MGIILTPQGKQKVSSFITECKALKKEILDAKKDTANETELPTEEDIIQDIEFWDDGNEYFNYWGVTDNYDSGYLHLERDVDYYG